MKKLLLFVASFVIILSSCKIDPTNDDPTPSEDPNMEDMIVTSDFDWKTTTDYSLTLKGNHSNIIEVVSDNEIVYQRAFLKAGITYEMKLTVPAYEESVNLKYMGKIIKIDLNSSTLSYEFE